MGRETFPTSVLVCKKFGTVVICGATSGYDLTFDVRYLWMRQKTIVGSHFANAYQAERANELVRTARSSRCSIRCSTSSTRRWRTSS